MKIAVISDLHLGPKDASDSFGHDDHAFLGFLRRLEADFEQIVLLGDIWETLTTARPFAAREGLKRAREAHPALARRFELPCYKYIHGNHDLIAAAVDGAPSEWLLDVDGIRLLFTHGHHHDWHLRHARWLSEWFVWLGGWACRVGASALYELVRIVDSAWSVPGPPLRNSFLRWAFSTAARRQANLIVTGHTHHAHRSEHEQWLYLNSGCCAKGQLSYLALDTARGQFSVCREAKG